MYTPYVLLFLIVTLGLVTSSTNKFENLGNKYLILPSEPISFVQALTLCQNYGMKLPIISSKEINSDLYDLCTRSNIPHTNFWIGGIYQNNSMYQGWSWLELTSEFEYSDWRVGEPIYVVGDNCIRWGFFASDLASEGLWRVGDCSQRIANLICERY